MPLYIVSHKDPISPSQRDELAAAITKIHSTLFTTPSLFVNVKFEDVSAASYYVGGKPTLINAIHAHVRPGPTRPRSAYDALCTQLRALWESVFPPNDTAITTPLDTIFILGSIIAGEEKGFMLPEAGKDSEWVKVHLAEFEKRAGEGDEEMRVLVEEVKARGLGV
ncbi:putative cis-3-chloroacrylic acid protein [Neofusicoccum parvum UCRNP2]|uniref:Tautomerase cis-CaaD-like domain-containing protein n=2 Tax=Neofusicoccum TaxID=407951 RepID=A0ABR3SXH4_9PEZI|nr:putative cis-3-chloroacrylic acid protein [Neofusicoccum parvum UCRNP2]